MRVDDREGGFLLQQVVEGRNQHRVLEHVGVVAGMERVAITEHAVMVTAVPARPGVDDPRVDSTSPVSRSLPGVSRFLPTLALAQRLLYKILEL